MKRLILTVSVLLGMKQTDKTPTRVVFLPDGRRITIPIHQNKIQLAYSVIPEKAMSYSDWWTYVRQRTEIDPEGLTITKFYL